MQLKTPAEACAALAVLIAGADEVGTVEEGRFVYDNIAGLPALARLDRPAFTKLMTETTDWIWSSFPTEGGRVTDAGVSDLLEMICGGLPRDMRVDALRAAVGLARSDGINEQEVVLLERICDGLEIDRSLLQESADPGTSPD